MRHSKTGHIIIITASACLLLALGCGLLGLAVQQGVITPKNINVELGPLIFIARGPRSFVCPQQTDPTSYRCYQLSSAPGPAFYRMWLFWYTPGRGTQSAHILAQWALPLRNESRNQGNRR
jgi:hypothetical protein